MNLKLHEICSYKAVWVSIGVVLGLELLNGCTITIPDSVVNDINNALTNKPPAVTTTTTIPTTTTTTTVPPVVDVMGELVDPNPSKYTEAYVSGAASYEECHIEPATGLMVRYCVWRPSVGQWWLLSSLGEGHVNKDGSNLVAENFMKDGQSIEVLGFCDYEPQTTDKPEALRFCAKGNTCPYDGSRRYIMAVVRKAK